MSIGTRCVASSGTRRIGAPEEKTVFAAAGSMNIFHSADVLSVLNIPPSPKFPGTPTAPPMITSWRIGVRRARSARKCLRKIRQRAQREDLHGMRGIGQPLGQDIQPRFVTRRRGVAPEE